jgi:hypothetical protein
MPHNQNMQLHNTTLQVGSPPPTLTCPFCLRHFHSKGGRTKHIQVKHRTNGSNGNPHALSLPPSPVPSLALSSVPSHTGNVQFEQPLSFIPSQSTPSPPPSHGEFYAADNNSDIGFEYPQFNRDYTPDLDVGDELNNNLDVLPRDDTPNTPQTTYTYHPKLDGK